MLDALHSLVLVLVILIRHFTLVAEVVAKSKLRWMRTRLYFRARMTAALARVCFQVLTLVWYYLT